MVNNSVRLFMLRAFEILQYWEEVCYRLSRPCLAGKKELFVLLAFHVFLEQMLH
jgi:hypothetical protein